MLRNEVTEKKKKHSPGVHTRISMALIPSCGMSRDERRFKLFLVHAELSPSNACIAYSGLNGSNAC